MKTRLEETGVVGAPPEDDEVNREIDAILAHNELPKVVQDMRRHDRHFLFGSVLLVGVVCGCTYYIISKLGYSPF